MAYSPLGLVVTGTPIASVWGNQIKANFDAIAGGATGQVLQAPGGTLGWTSTPTFGGLTTITAGGLQVNVGNIGSGGAPSALARYATPGTMVASGGFSTGYFANGTFQASANSDTLAGVYVNPTYDANAKTGTKAYGVYIAAPSGAATNIGLYNLGTSRFDGNMAMGAAPVTWAALYVSASVTSDGSTGGYSITTRNAPVVAAVNSDSLFGIGIQNLFSLAGKTGVSCYGMHVSPSWAAAGSNYGIWIAAVTGATNNYGIYINAPSGGTINVGLQNQGTSVLTGTVTFGSGSQAWTTVNLGVGAAYGQFINTGGNAYFGLDNSTGGTFYGVSYALTVAHSGAFPILFATGNTARWQINANGHLIGHTDNAYDIGAAGATRPRTIYIGTNIFIGASPATTGTIRMSNPGSIVAKTTGGVDVTSIWRRNDDVLQVGDATVGGANHYHSATGHLWAINNGQYAELTTAALRPITDLGLTIGDASHRWSSAFVNTMIVGTNPAGVGAIRMENNTSIYARNAANSANLSVATYNASNVLTLGDNSASGIDLRVGNSVQINMIVNNVLSCFAANTGFMPGGDNAFDLGFSGTGRWRDVYCARGAFNGSERSLKRNIAMFSPASALDIALDTKIVRYQYKQMGNDDPNAERWHIGFIADDAPDALSPDHKTVNPQTTASIALAAIQELASRVKKLESIAQGA